MAFPNYSAKTFLTLRTRSSQGFFRFSCVLSDLSGERFDFEKIKQASDNPLAPSFFRDLLGTQFGLLTSD